MTSLPSESTPESVARHGTAAPASIERDPLETLEALEAWIDSLLEPERRRRRLASTTEGREAAVLMKVVRLASSLEVAEAMLRGERVPRSRLDPKWLKAYGL